LAVTKIADLAGVVVPHFERYPLRSKKVNDFTIWKAGVALVRDVSSRPHPTKTVGWHKQKGSSKWLADERTEFKHLVEHLKTSHLYGAKLPAAHLPTKAAPELPTLFAD
jgi:hypothetical protein